MGYGFIIPPDNLLMRFIVLFKLLILQDSHSPATQCFVQRYFCRLIQPTVKRKGNKPFLNWFFIAFENNLSMSTSVLS